MKQSHKSGWKKMQKWVSLTLLLVGLLLLIVGIAVDVFPVIGAGLLCCVMAAMVFMPNRMRRDRGYMGFGNKWGSEIGRASCRERV